MTTGDAHGVIFNVDSVLRLGSPRRQLARLRALRTTSLRDRRSMLAMPRLVRALSADLNSAPVFYLTAFPIVLAKPITALLERDGYPSGTLLTTGRSFTARWVFGGSRTRKLAGIECLADRMPNVRWVLLGDDGGHDPQVFVDFAHRHRDRVAVIALRQVLDVDSPRINLPSRPAAPSARPWSGHPTAKSSCRWCERLSGSDSPARVPPRTGSSRSSNAATRPPASGCGPRATWFVPLVHGRVYYDALWRQPDRDGRRRLDPVRGVAGRCRSAPRRRWADGRRGADRGGRSWRAGARAAVARARRRGGIAGRSEPDARPRRQPGRRRGVVGPTGAPVRLPPPEDGRRPPCGRPQDDVAFIGGIDLDHGSRDDADHHGDRQSVGADPVYGPNPAYHDLQLHLQGPVVREAEETFRERWQNPAAVTRLPWHVDPGPDPRPPTAPRRRFPPAPPAPPAAGTCAVQLLRTYPRRRPRYPYAPRGERSIALAYTKALGRAEQLIYLEDQYLWSFDVARIFAAALQRSPRLQLIAVVPRRPDNENQFYNESAMLGHAEALAMVREAGEDRVQVLDVENLQGLPVYVHAKLCIVDDVWAAVGSDNFNMRSWTHDSELTAAVLDSERDPRAPTDPGGLGDGARRFARELRLTMLREHLGLDEDDDLLDPVRAADMVRKSAAELDAWHDGGCSEPRPAGRLRSHPVGKEGELPARHRWFTAPIYRSFLDPDGRPLDMRLRRTY